MAPLVEVVLRLGYAPLEAGTERGEHQEETSQGVWEAIYGGKLIGLGGVLRTMGGSAALRLAIPGVPDTEQMNQLHQPREEERSHVR